ncbi:MAG: 23S rRNA (adenine(2503)-C(2))-methyltransferase RlmN [Alphaproteobacteria bacterium]|nr:23S rRNA (adenine(2503)-C(2))-methyltransferase RlmN [Alphaproteobacteria bacterium]
MDTSGPDLLGLPYPALEAWLDEVGVGRTHAARVFRGLHRTRVPLDEVRDLGRHAATIDSRAWRAQAAIAEIVPAPGGVERVVFALRDGARVEGVVLPSHAPGRVTLCLSSQVGCAMGCRFCATGTLGLTRDLTAGEIVAEVHAVRAHLAGTGRSLTHLVFMGMGEPLHAYRAVRDALFVLFDHHGEPFDRRKVTVSTVGLVDRMGTLLEDFDGRIQLALSLHAGTDATRRAIIPSARASTLADLRVAAEAYEQRANGRLMVEYVVLPGLNDTPDEIAGLAAWMSGLRGIVNLIPFNPFVGAGFRSPTDGEVKAVYTRLRERDVPVKVRWPRGRAAHGACGQLMLAPADAATRTPAS